MSDLFMFDVASEGMGLALVLILLSHSLNEDRKYHDHNMAFIYIGAGVALMLGSDIATRVMNGMPGKLVHTGMMVSVFLLFFSYLATSLFYVHYMYSYIGFAKSVGRRELSIQLILALTNFILLIITQFTGFFYTIDANNVYHRAPGMYFFGVSMLLLEFTVLLLIINGRKYMEPVELNSAFVFVALPFLATAVQVIYYGFAAGNLAVVVALFLVYFNIQARRSRMFAEQQKAMAEQQISLMISQIQPHFLYNAISSIRELCLIDANEARDSLGDFAMYLRANMDSIKATKPVPFEKELNHVEHYLNIEKLRFGDLLEVEYDISVIDFDLPALSLQPLVENAVKHGTCASDDGGKVWISTKEDEKNKAVLITVRDDGPGFECDCYENIPIKKDDGRSHIGLNNVHDRITEMSGGKLLFESHEGVGTTVTIVIPR